MEGWSEIVPPLQLGKKYKYFFQVKKIKTVFHICLERPGNLAIWLFKELSNF